MELRHMDTTARILIAASRERVWEALTGEVSAWWGAPYLLLDDAPAAETFSLIAEPRVGAPVLETLGDQQAMWGVVNGLSDRMCVWCRRVMSVRPILSWPRGLLRR